MFERFSDRSRRVLVHAQNEARLLGHRQIGTEHLLLGLLCDADGLAGRALGPLGLSLDEARARVASTSEQAVELHPTFTRSARRVIERAHQVSVSTHEATVTTKHLLLGLLDVGDAASSRLLGSFGATTERVRTALVDLPAEEPHLPRARDRARPGAVVAQTGDQPVGQGTLGPLPARAQPPPELPAVLVAELERRYEELPVARIRRDADFWALWRVEEEHIDRLARGYHLDEATEDLARGWWLGEVRGRCADAAAWAHRREQRHLHRTVRRRLFRPNAAFQLYWNTVGPGARTWFGNRYATIRRYTFRMHWRP